MQSAGDTSAHAVLPLTMRERAYQHIQKLIGEGTLKAGSALSELLLAKELGSSRTPIREALGQLVAEGLLEQTSAGTTLVVQLHRGDVIELYELREALELYAIEKVAHANLHASDRARLQRLVDEILILKQELKTSGQPSLDADQMRRFLSTDLAFHSMLISMAHNSRIQKVLSDMRLLIRIFSIHRRGHEPDLLDTIHSHHQGILDAIVHGNADAARKVLSEHIRTSLQERLEDFDHRRREEYLRESLPGVFDSASLLFSRNP